MKTIKLDSFKGAHVKNFRGTHSLKVNNQKFTITSDRNNQVCDIQPRQLFCERTESFVDCLALTRGTGLHYAEDILTEYFG